jgi:N-acetylmuramoyl-L-alanine amidase
MAEPPRLPPIDAADRSARLGRGARRRLDRRARRALKQRSASRSNDPVVRRVKPKTPASWQAKLATLVLLSVLFVSIGAGRFGAKDAVEPTPTVPSLAASAVIVHVETSTSTPPVTKTPEPTVSPTLTPTPDPAFAGKVICLDPGHGGSDRGYTRAADALAPAMEEAAYNLDVALDLRDRLRRLGFAVAMTRTADLDVNSAGADVNGDGQTYANLIATDPVKAQRARQIDELQARINVCNLAKADLLISIHLNGFTDSKVGGYETWFSSARPFVANNRRIAQLVFDQLGQQMRAAGYNARARRVNDDADANVIASGDVFDRYIITGPAEPGKITPSVMPGAIIESLFISNDQDAAFLATAAGQDAIATALQEAIRAYFSGAGG